MFNRDQPEVTCHFCKVMTTLENAIESGWAPGFYQNNQEVCSPVCTQCLAQYCCFNEEYGDYEITE